MTWFGVFTNKRQITIHASQVVNSDQNNFAVWLTFSAGDLATTGNGGVVTSASGYDIVPVNAGESAILNFELISYDPVAGLISMYVSLATVSHTIDTTFYLYYGNNTITTSQANTTAVWDIDYMAVYHFPEQSGTSNNDSTSNAANLTKQSAGHPASAAGPLSGSYASSFNGSSDFESTAASSVKVTGDRTIELLANPSTYVYPGGIASRLFFQNMDNTNAHQLTLESSAANTANSFVFAVNDSSGQYMVSGSSNLAANAWYYLFATYVSASHTISLAVNNVLISGGNASGWGIASSGSLYLGERQDGSGLFAGLLGEARLSNIVRSSDYRGTVYNNLSSPSTFYAVGGSQTKPSGATSIFVVRQHRHPPGGFL